MSRYTEAVKLQKELAPTVVTRDAFESIETVCAVDVSYKGCVANAAAVIMDARTMEVLEHATATTRVKIPYVPGLMMLREAGPVMSVLRRLKRNYDVLLVDGNGQLHPRRFGLACYLGVTLGKPAVGVAKSLLCGTVRKDSVILGGRTVARIVRRAEGRRIFVSIGNGISLKTAAKLARSFIMDGQWLPEPLRLADMYSKQVPPGTRAAGKL